jgi:WD40 repeat protein
MEVHEGQVLKSYVLREQVYGDDLVISYLAERLTDNQEVLIRVVSPQVANEPYFIRDFEKEVQVLARLEHPHIVPLSDYWRDPTGAYLVTPVTSPSRLKQHLGTPWELDAIACITDQIGTALGYAHANGVVHGDIRPEHILTDDKRNFYLTGFAVARMLRSDTKRLFAWKGTDYVSPEEFWGKPISLKTDIYSFAIILYELLTGETLNGRHVYESIPNVCDKRTGVSQIVNDVIQRAATKDSSGGYENLLDMVTDLQRALLGKPSVPLIIPVTNPYPGPRPFVEADVGNFFGREALTRALLARMDKEDGGVRFLAVVGPSGSGKSSVVRAGLISALRQGGLPGSDEWFVAVMVPSNHPFDELEIVLNKLAGHSTTNVMDQLKRDQRGLFRAIRMILPEGSQLVLVIDQFEELFTQVSDHETVQRFLELIYTAAIQPHTPIYIIITLRADFTDQALLDPHFGSLMRHRTEFITRMTPDELRQAIVRPAERVGVQVDPALIAAVINEVVQHPGTLPMMQYALAQVFDEREGGTTLMLEAYNRIGGTLGAMTRRADDAYSRLEPQQQAMTEQLFLRLVTLGEGVEDTRRRALQRELLNVGGDIMTSVMSVFVQSRLLVVDRDPVTHEETIELAHEAILRRWQQLRIWLDENRADIRMQRQLSVAAGTWLDASQDTSFLLRGTHLQQFEDWRKEIRLLLTPHDRSFLEASIAERERLKAEEHTRQEREQGLERRVRHFLLAIIGLLLLASMIGIRLSLLMQHESRRVQALAHVANAQLAMHRGDPDTAIALAIAAIGLSEAPPDVQHIVNEIVENARTRTLMTGHSETVRTVALNRSGTLAVSGSDDNSLILWDVVSGQEISRLTGHMGNVMSAVFTPGGDHVLSASNDGGLILWNVAQGTPEFGNPVLQFQDHAQRVLTVALSPDGKLAVSGGCSRFDGPTCLEGELIVWDVNTGLPIRQFLGHRDWVWSVAFSPDGKYIVSGSDDHSLILWNVMIEDDPETEVNDEIIHRLVGHTDSVRSVAFSPDGRRVLSGSNDNSLILWNMAQDSPTFGQIIRRFEGHTDNVRSVAFSPDGQEILSGSDDRTIIQWQMFTGQRIRTYTGHLQGVTSVVFGPSARHVALSGSIDHTLRLWSLNEDDILEPTVESICQNRYVRPLTLEEEQKYRVFSPTCESTSTS